MRRPITSRIVRRSLVSAILLAGLCGVISLATHGGAGRAAPAPAGDPEVLAPAAATPTPCGEMTEHIQTDFSGGEYRGTVSYPAEGMNGEATLTVSGSADNQTFSLQAGGKTLTGRLSSLTTCGYTALALKFDDTTPPDPSKPPPPAAPSFSLRACREASQAVLRSRELAEFTFTAKGPPPRREDGKPEWGVCKPGKGRLGGKLPL